MALRIGQRESLGDLKTMGNDLEELQRVYHRILRNLPTDVKDKISNHAMLRDCHGLESLLDISIYTNIEKYHKQRTILQNRNKLLHLRKKARMRRFLIRNLEGTMEFSNFLKGKGKLTNDVCISTIHTCNVEVPRDRLETQASIATDSEMQSEQHKEIT